MRIAIAIATLVTLAACGGAGQGPTAVIVEEKAAPDVTADLDQQKGETGRTQDETPHGKGPGGSGGGSNGAPSGT